MSGLFDFLGMSGGDSGGAGAGQPVLSQPQLMGILGSLAAAGAANPPQAASRLPLAKPSPFYILSQQAGGFANGYNQGLQNNQVKAQTSAANLKNMNDLQQYNFWAPILGQPTISLSDLANGNFNQQVAKAAQSAGQGQGAPSQVSAPVPQTQPAALPAGAPAALSQGGGPTVQNAAAMDAMQPPLAQQSRPPAQAPFAGPPTAPGAPPSAAGGTPQAMTGALLNLPYAVRLKFAPQMVSPIENEAAAAGLDPDSPQVKQAVQLNMQEKSGQVIPPSRGFAGATMGPNGPQFFPSGVAGLGAQAGATAAATYPYDIGKIAAGAGQTRFTDAYNSWLKTGVWPAGVPGGPPGTALPAIQPPIASAPSTGPRVAPTMTSALAPSASMAAPGSAPAAITPKGIVTEKGTTIPAAPPIGQQLGSGTDEISKSIDRSSDVLKNYAPMRSQLEQLQSRMSMLAGTLKATESTGFNEERADLAVKARGLGLDKLADALASKKQVTDIQTATGAQTLDILQQLKTATSGGGNRILNSEFIHTLDTQYGPNLDPGANFNLISQVMGATYQSMNLIDDWQDAKAAGWRNAEDYQTSYLQKNPINGFVDYAKKEIGPLKGMGDAPPDISKATSTRQIGNQKFYQIGGQWYQQ